LYYFSNVYTLFINEEPATDNAVRTRFW